MLYTHKNNNLLSQTDSCKNPRRETSNRKMVLCWHRCRHKQAAAARQSLRTTSLDLPPHTADGLRLSPHLPMTGRVQFSAIKNSLALRQSSWSFFDQEAKNGKQSNSIQFTRRTDRLIQKITSKNLDIAVIRTSSRTSLFFTRCNC